MKKLLFIATVSLFATATAKAQWSPEKGDFAVEIGFTPFKSGGETFQLNEGMLKARYFITGKDAIRLKLGLDIDNQTSTETSSYDPADKRGSYYVSESETKNKDKHTDFSILVGYERHLFTKGRFDVYTGLELGYILGKSSGTKTYSSVRSDYDSEGKFNGSSVTNTVTDYYNRNVAGDRTSQNYFSGNLFAGVDCYVWKNLYLGAELGLGLKAGKSPNSYYSYTEVSTEYNASNAMVNQRTTRFDGSTGVTTITNTPSSSSSSTPSTAMVRNNETTSTQLNLFVEPAVRIGWRF